MEVISSMLNFIVQKFANLTRIVFGTRGKISHEKSVYMSNIIDDVGNEEITHLFTDDDIEKMIHPKI